MPQDTLANQIIAYLRQEETNYTEAAGKFGADAIPILQDIIKGSDEMLASKAVYLVSMIDAPGREQAMTIASQHASAIVRVAAAATADKLAPANAEVLLNRLVDDSDIGVAKFSLRSIKSRGLSKNFKTKIAGMSTKHFDTDIKTQAATMLKAIK